MRQHPDNGFVFCGAGISAYLRGDTAEGVALLEKGVELTERAPVALIMLAQGYGYAGQKERCCRCWKRPSGRRSTCAPTKRPRPT